VPGITGSFSSTGRPLHISLSTSAWPQALCGQPVRVEYAIQIDGTVIVMGRINFVASFYNGAKSDGLRQYAHFSKIVTNIPSGSHTVKIRWRIVDASGCSIVNADSEDYFQLSIIEGGL
jgi:hypothetical protein